MNNDKLKATTSSFTTTARRPSATGKFKLPKKQIQPMTTLTKKPFLKEYSLAMESKLQTLKEKISQKKKQKPIQQSLKTSKQTTNIQNFLKPKIKKQTSKQIQQKLIISQLEQFLSQNNLLIYKSLLLENQIDSLQILAEATQKELEEIGIPKGHALKLKVNISKLMAAKRPGTQEKGKTNPRQNKTKDTERNKSFLSTSNNNENINNTQKIKNLNTQLQSICIGTQQDGIQSITFVTNNNQNVKKRTNKFCLFCYQSIKPQQNLISKQFCSQDCQDRYNQMFKIYENNLLKAQQEFKNDIKPSQQNQQNQEQNLQQNHQFQLFDEIDQGYQDFDYESYEEMKKQLTGL